MEGEYIVSVKPECVSVCEKDNRCAQHSKCTINVCEQVDRYEYDVCVSRLLSVGGYDSPHMTYLSFLLQFGYFTRDANS